MGKAIYEGQYTTENDRDMVVFLIGMRINKRMAVRKWLPAFTAMPGMIKELYQHKDELGFLSMENYFGLRTTVMITYWRSEDDLLAYAKGQKHLKAWKKFNKKIGNTDAVGVYHETYIVPKGNYESIYTNMPVYGLAKASGHMLVTSETRSAKKRLRAGVK